MQYPYVDVANAILEISRARPIVRKPWLCIFDTDCSCDGVECDTLEEAQSYAEDCLVEWATEEMSKWEDINNPTEEEIDDYDYMIYNCASYVQKYDEWTDKYEDYWYPDEEKLGWLPWEEFKNAYLN